MVICEFSVWIFKNWSSFYYVVWWVQYMYRNVEHNHILRFILFEYYITYMILGETSSSLKCRRPLKCKFRKLNSSFDMKIVLHNLYWFLLKKFLWWFNRDTFIESFCEVVVVNKGRKLSWSLLEPYRQHRFSNLYFLGLCYE